MGDPPLDSLHQQKKLIEQHPQLFDELSALLFRHDPIHLNFETNTDEYDPEEIQWRIEKLREAREATLRDVKLPAEFGAGL